MNSHKRVPAAFMILSVLYFIFVVTSEQSKMIGDELGGDPGSMLLPLILSVGMFILSAFIFFTEKETKQEVLSKQQLQLLFFTLVLCIVYVLTYRQIGFILNSTILLFLLTYNFSNQNAQKNIKSVALGLLATLFGMLLVYTIGREISSLLFSLARSTKIVWIGSSFTVFSANILVLALVFLGLKALSSRILRKKIEKAPYIRTMHICAFVTIATVELLFLIFRQLFLVNLSAGLINW